MKKNKKVGGAVKSTIIIYEDLNYFFLKFSDGHLEKVEKRKNETIYDYVNYLEENKIYENYNLILGEDKDDYNL